MSLLLDTHTLLWFASGDHQLPKEIKSKITDTNTSCFISVASLWEITIKLKLGKLRLAISLEQLFHILEDNQIDVIQISYDHLFILSELPHYHSDPFDRLIISQAISEKMSLVSKDKQLHNYRVRTIWKKS